MNGLLSESIDEWMIDWINKELIEAFLNISMIDWMNKELIAAFFNKLMIDWTCYWINEEISWSIKELLNQLDQFDDFNRSVNQAYSKIFFILDLPIRDLSFENPSN